MGMQEAVEQRQMEQIQRVQKAYAEVKSPLDSYTMFSEVKPDGIDHAYAWARTFTPSWVMALIFIAGLLALAPAILNKFGIDLNFSIKKRGG